MRLLGEEPWIPTLDVASIPVALWPQATQGLHVQPGRGPAVHRGLGQCLQSSASLHCWRASWTDHPGPSNRVATRSAPSTTRRHVSRGHGSTLWGCHDSSGVDGRTPPDGAPRIVVRRLRSRAARGRHLHRGLLPPLLGSHRADLGVPLSTGCSYLEGIGSTQSVGGFSSCSEG